MAKSRGSGAGGSDQQREIVVTFDKRLMWAIILLGSFALAVGAGYLVSRPDAPGAPAPAADAGGAEAAPQDISEADARATAAKLGLPTGVVIVTPNAFQVVTSTAGATPPPGGLRFLSPTEQAQMTPGPGVVPDLPPGGRAFEVNPDPSQYKNHEVLANTVDPNVDKTEHRPLRLETVSKPVDGPRLAISDLNENYTYDFGIVKMTDKASHAFVAKNVGTEDLVISRVYTGCGCTATTIAGQAIPPDGSLPEPLTIKPGEEVAFEVEFDAAAEQRAGAES
jgi:hypothetical protein